MKRKLNDLPLILSIVLFLVGSLKLKIIEHPQDKAIRLQLQNYPFTKNQTIFYPLCLIQNNIVVQQQNCLYTIEIITGIQNSVESIFNINSDITLLFCQHLKCSNVKSLFYHKIDHYIKIMLKEEDLASFVNQIEFLHSNVQHPFRNGICKYHVINGKVVVLFNSITSLANFIFLNSKIRCNEIIQILGFTLLAIFWTYNFNFFINIGEKINIILFLITIAQKKFKTQLTIAKIILQ